LLRQLRSLVIQKSLLRIELVDGVSVEDALRADLIVGLTHIVDGCVDIVSGLKVVNEVLNRLKHVGSIARKKLGTGHIAFYRQVIPDRSRIRHGVSYITHSGGASGVNDIRGSTGGCSSEDIAALVGEIREMDQLRLDPLHFAGKGSTVGIIEGAVGSLSSQADGPLQYRDHRIDGRVGILQFSR